jgi:hypothetical protein
VLIKIVDDAPEICATARSGLDVPDRPPGHSYYSERRVGQHIGTGRPPLMKK